MLVHIYDVTGGSSAKSDEAIVKFNNLTRNALGVGGVFHSGVEVRNVSDTVVSYKIWWRSIHSRPAVATFAVDFCSNNLGNSSLVRPTCQQSCL